MLLMRPVAIGDVDDLARLASIAGEGMTSLPEDKQALTVNVESAIHSFKRSSPNPNDYFLMVLEDTEAHRVVGTSAVYARTGSRQAFYAYRVMSVTHYSHSIEKEVRSNLLHLTNDYTDCSEVGTLFLDPDYRGNGHWLSRSRYLLMAQYPQRFAPDVIAELRGWFDEAGVSPFWEALGAKFFQMPYAEADRLCGTGSNQFITELMPKYPIYSNLLPKAAEDVMGKPHDSTRRAMDLLLDEGFQYENLIDVFDGGPLVRANIAQIRSVQQAVQYRVELMSGEESTAGGASQDKMLVANTSLANLRIIYANAIPEGESLYMDSIGLNALQVGIGDQVVAIPGQLA
ncbi:MAG: arginine N-succinyltransferase [Patiriisocius sp.]|jgi:arginine N-succinyltransferase